ncbi:hypothetical protein AB0C81_18090 [Streptomyces roseoverticillatus]|uniref:hypothetical protein n=1 Tax=Streptomyces roseoverticillatus TaxID=66429 RepID=UPI00340FDEBB
MMIDLSFSPDPECDFPRSGRKKALELVSEMDLRYGYFEADITFRVSGADFFQPAGKFPLIDFMFTLAYSVLGIRDSGIGEIDFTESSNWIRVEQCEDVLTFRNKLGDKNGTCSVVEYVSAVKAFIESGITDTVSRHPQMAGHPTLLKLSHLPIT